MPSFLRWLPGQSVVRRLRASGLLLPIVLGLAVVGLLLEGALGNRRVVSDSTQAPPASPSPSPSAFRPNLEKGPLTYLSDYWLQVANSAQPVLQGFGPERIPGVVIRPGLALSSIQAADALVAAADDGSWGRLVAADARQGVAVLALPPGSEAVPLAPAEKLHPAAWLAAVTIDGRGLQVTPGYLASGVPSEPGLIDVAVPFPASLSVAAVVDLDSRLVGVALRTSSGVRVLSADKAAELVERLSSGAVCRGLDVGPLPDAVRKSLRLGGGVVVETLWAPAFATAPGLEPGDVLLQWGKRKVSSPEEFGAAYDTLAPGSRLRFVAVRGQQRVAGQTEMPGRDCRPVRRGPRALALLGAVGRWDRVDGPPAREATEGLRLLGVPRGSPAQRAGLEPDDLIVAVDGQRLVWPEGLRLLDASQRPRQPLILTVRRGDRVTLRAAPVAGE